MANIPEVADGKIQRRLGKESDDELDDPDTKTKTHDEQQKTGGNHLQEQFELAGQEGRPQEV